MRIIGYTSEAVAPTLTLQPWRITVCELTGAIWIERRTGGTKEAVCKMGPNFSEGRDLANAELILSALAENRDGKGKMKITIEIKSGMVSGVFYGGADKKEHLPEIFVVDRDGEQIGEPVIAEEHELIPLRLADEETRKA